MNKMHITELSEKVKQAWKQIQLPPSAFLFMISDEMTRSNMKARAMANAMFSINNADKVCWKFKLLTMEFEEEFDSEQWCNELDSAGYDWSVFY